MPDATRSQILSPAGLVRPCSTSRRATEAITSLPRIVGLGALLLFMACAPDRDADHADPAQSTDADTVSDLTAADAVPGRSVGDVVVTIHFTRNDSVLPVQRRAHTGTLAASLQELLRGPTAEERAQGMTSWFSDSTATMLRSATIDASGTAFVDFGDLRRVIPNASTSAGGFLLLGPLNATVFEHEEVAEVWYSIDGSCDVFWDWLQYGCQVVRRPEH